MRKSQVYGFVGSALSCVLLFLLLWFVYLNTTPPLEEEGIMVSFGNAETGAGFGETTPTTTHSVPPPPPTPTTPSSNDLMTQDEESLALQEQAKEEARKKAAEQAEIIRKQKEEQARIEAERIAQEKAAAEQARREQEAKDKAEKLGSLFGSNQGSAGSGNSQGTNVEGNPVGKGTSGGNSWSLNGRNLKGHLAQPAYDSNEEGKVVVTIRVNADGQVVAATVGSGTTISSKAIQNAAIKAAQTARFSSGIGEVSGTITYNFKLR